MKRKNLPENDENNLESQQKKIKLKKLINLWRKDGFTQVT